ncbi:hypothetical protein [Planctomicrobium sp. SH664]|uniref:hypothetical protein n=1 Tax=Planctomicrobium sp. SH664 TaxID=3448125 RepID=UPI003F5B7AD7
MNALLAISWQQLCGWGLLAVFVFLGTIGVVRLLRRQRASEWQKLSRRLRLTFRQTAEGPQVTGQLAGRHVTLRNSDESSDANGGVVLTLMEVELANLPQGLKAEAAPGLIGDLSNLAEERLLTGDEEFDRNVHLTSDTGPAALSYWNESRRRSFLHLVQQDVYDQLTLSGNRLTLRLRSVIANQQQLEQTLRLLVDAARQLDNPTTDSLS